MKNLFFLLVFFPTFLFGQSQLGLFGSADLTNCNYGWDSFNGSIRNSKEAKFNTHFGVNYYQKLKEKIWLKVGLGFSSTGYQQQIDGSGLRYGSQHDGQGGFNPNLPSEDITIKYNHHFIEVPIALHFDFSNKKINPFVELGVSTMYYLQTVSILEQNNRSRNVDKNRANSINQIQIAPTFAFGVNYAFNEKWTLFVQPNFRYHLTKMVKYFGKEHQWSAGLAVGMRMKL
ncbi:MAG: hypothetical protein ACJAT4_000518 [Granulosicoccus sp.]|jgi:hypothetical protein